MLPKHGASQETGLAVNLLLCGREVGLHMYHIQTTPPGTDKQEALFR